jgi:hypothetical protein
MKQWLRLEARFGLADSQWFGYGLVADGLHDPAGLQRVVEEEVVVRRVLVRDSLKKKKKKHFFF